MPTCFYIGHREIHDSLLPLLGRTIEQHIAEYGVDKFVVGHYGAFDRMAAKMVRIAKRKYPHIRLILLLPYFPDGKATILTEDFDASFYPPDMETVPKRFAIVKANEYMIRNSEYLICYYRGLVGKTRDFVELAMRRERRGLMHVCNLAEI